MAISKDKINSPMPKAGQTVSQASPTAPVRITKTKPAAKPKKK